MKVLRDRGSENDWEVQFENFYNENFERFLRYAFSLTESKSLAEDVVSEVFLIFWNRKDQIQHIEDWNAYAARSIRNLAIKLKISKFKEQGLDLGYAETVKHNVDPESILLGKELESIIQNVFETLTPHGKLVYDMARNKGYSHDRIAEELGISKLTVQKHLSNVLREFRITLRKRFSDSSDQPVYLSKLVSLIGVILFSSIL